MKSNIENRGRQMLAAGLVLALVIGAGCSSDDPVETQREFAVAITVLGTDDHPVPGLALAMVNEVPGLQGAAAGSRAACAVEFRMPREATVRLTVEDIDGDHVKTLLDDDEHVAGDHRTTWHGTNDQFVNQPSGRYTVRMVATNAAGDTTLFTDARDCYLADPDPEENSVAMTNDAGAIVLTVRKHFPQVYDHGPMPHLNEEAEELGEFTLTEAMYFAFRDTASGDVHTYEGTVSEGRNDLIFVWDPEPQPATTTTVPPVVVGRDEGVASIQWQLRTPFPNPFH